MQPVGAATKREPSHYRLAAHKYMLARKRGIISGPRVHTRASVVPKKDEPNPENTDSDATVILDSNNKPPVPAKNKTRGRNKNTNKRKRQKPSLPKPMCSEKEDYPGEQRTKEKDCTYSSV